MDAPKLDAETMTVSTPATVSNTTGLNIEAATDVASAMLDASDTETGKIARAAKVSEAPTDSLM
jgi:hypothetical protein